MEENTTVIPEPQETPVVSEPAVPVNTTPAPQPGVPAAPKQKSKLGLILAIAIPVLVIAIVVSIFAGISISKNNKYKTALEYLDDGDIEEAVAIHEELGSYKDLDVQIVDTAVDEFEDYLDDGNYKKAFRVYAAAANYSDAISEMDELLQEHAEELVNNYNYSTLDSLFDRAVKDGVAVDTMANIVANSVSPLLDDYSFYSAMEVYKTLDGFDGAQAVAAQLISDKCAALFEEDYYYAYDLYYAMEYYELTIDGVLSAMYDYACKMLEEGSYYTAESLFTELGDYQDSADKLAEVEYAQALSDLQYYLDNGWYDSARYLVDEYTGEVYDKLLAVYMDYCADNTFISDLEASILLRMEMEAEGYSYSEIVEAELEYMSKYYYDLPFYDTTLRDAAYDYVEEIYNREWATYYDDYYGEYYWNYYTARGYQALDALADYGFGASDSSLSALLGTGAELQEYWDAWYDIYSDLDWQMWSYLYEDDGVYYRPFTSYSSYTYTVVFTAYTTDSSGNILTELEQEFTMNYYDTVNVIVDLPDDYWNWDITWEITDIELD